MLVSSAPKSQGTNLLLKAFTSIRHQEKLRIYTKCLSKKFMTYELNLSCIWQHPTTGNQPEITKIFWEEVEKPIIITVRSLRQAQPGTWKKPIKQDTEDLIHLPSSLVDFTNFPFFPQAHRLQKHLVKELILSCQSLTHDSGQSSSKRPKTSY